MISWISRKSGSATPTKKKRSTTRTMSPVRPGDEVLDSFGGTCPIFEAAHTYQCKAVALEANPEYFAMGLRRLQALQQSEQPALL